MIHDPADEQQLIHTILSFRNDPEGLVMFLFPWGKVGSPLQYHKGPRAWQLKALRKIKAHIEQNVRNQVDNKPLDLLKMARASGRGIGKSAFLAWISIWLFSCVIGSTTVVSANSEQQLKTKTFPEIKKWATMALNSHWFEMNIMSIKAAPWLVKNLKETSDIDDAYWYIQASLWSEENPDAYAGNHSQLGMAVLFDEASGIPSSIWPVAEGFFTDKTTHRLWFVISNPRNPNGEFFECFHKGRDQWDTEHIDARTVEENDQGIYENIINRYGEDSDEARIEVYGKFPAQGENQFISRDVV
ncbi:MAG: terminase, partial [Pseudomonadales bacterium]